MALPALQTDQSEEPGIATQVNIVIGNGMTNEINKIALAYCNI
jgi:hypothetical protein